MKKIKRILNDIRFYMIAKLANGEEMVLNKNITSTASIIEYCHFINSPITIIHKKDDKPVEMSSCTIERCDTGITVVDG